MSEVPELVSRTAMSEVPKVLFVKDLHVSNQIRKPSHEHVSHDRTKHRHSSLKSNDGANSAEQVNPTAIYRRYERPPRKKKSPKHKISDALETLTDENICLCYRGG